MSADSSGLDETQVLDPEDDEDEIEVSPPAADESLRYFGVDFDVEGLVRRFERKELIVPTFDPEVAENENTGYQGFQRNFVWKKRQMDRFIESILLGYPVPGIFLVELVSREYIVLDGQQRLTTLKGFYNEVVPGTENSPRAFTLEYVDKDSPFKGRSYSTLPADYRRKLNNAIIQATVTLPQGEHGKLAIYALFERINSGGTQLKDQQIRVAIYAEGAATHLIRQMNSDPEWRRLFGPVHRDLRDQELILRYLSLKEVAKSFSPINDSEAKPFRPPMATFMTTYLDEHSSMTVADQEREIAEFSTACKLILDAYGPSALKKNQTVNAARTDAILAGLTLAIRRDPEIDSTHVARALDALNEDPDFSEHTQKSTSHRAAVNMRLQRSLEFFTE